MRKLGWHSLGTSFDCSCGVTHAIPIEACYIGVDAAEKLAQFARDRCGRSCLVVSDQQTRHVGGERLLSALSSVGKRVEERVYGGARLEATEALGEEVIRLGGQMDFFVAIGSGTLSDLAKYAGDKHRRPVLLYPTAPSMNGYTSAIVALNARGLKRTLPCAPALGVFADPEVVATAPARMAAAGVGDFLSKCSSCSGWYAAHFLRGGYYCERPREFFEGIQEQVFAAAPGVRQADPEAVATLLEALLLAGLSMVVAGSSAPASGGEHLISHYLDMKHVLRGTPNDLHGAQVGVATVHCLGLWEKVLAIEPGQLDVEAALDAQPSDQQVRTWVEEDWGPAAPEVLAQWQAKALDRDGLRTELERFTRGLDALRKGVERDLLPAGTVTAAIHSAGGPTAPEGLDAPTEEYHNALRYARFLRDRFTILDLAAEVGLS